MAHHPASAVYAARKLRTAAAFLALGFPLGTVAPPAVAQAQQTFGDVRHVVIQTAERCSPVVVGAGGNVTINNSCPIGLTPQDLERIGAAVRGGLAVVFAEQIGELSARLGVTRTALETFFRLLGERQVADTDLDARLRELAARYLRFSQVLAHVGSSDSGIQDLRLALERGDVEGVSGAVRGLETRLAAEAGEVAAERANARTAVRDLAEQVRRRGIRAGGVLAHAKRWQPGSILRFCFLDGNLEQRRRVASVARGWSLYANLDLDFGLRDLPRDCSTQGDSSTFLRITLNNQGNWAFVGTDARGAPARQPQISITLPPLHSGADMDQEANRMILHEFGHLIGFVHGFSHPKARCAERVDWELARRWAAVRGWNVAVLRSVLAGSPSEEVKAGDIDPESVMTYVLPAEIFRDDSASDCIHTPGPGLSLGDKLAALEAYP